jgi:hypothetical protein
MIEDTAFDFYKYSAYNITMNITSIEEKKQKKREYNRIYRVTNPERGLIAQRKYRAANREKILEYNRVYRKANHEKILESGRKHRAAHPFSDKGRDAQRKRRGLPIATRLCPDFCEGCGIHKDKLKNALHSDHDHITNKFRGWLCTACNLGLGLLGDSKQNLLNMINYLDKTL